MSMNRRANVLIVAGAVGAGVHGAIAPEHVREWTPLGVAFVVTAVLLGAAVATLALRPTSVRAARAVAVVLAGVVVGYVATRVAALPPLDPEREPLDPLGVATTLIEATGLAFAFPFTLTSGGTQ
jgi:hypothetical protein